MIREETRRVRARFLLYALGVLFLVLVARAAQLQVIGGRRYAELAEQNRAKIIRIPATRGLILDRQGSVLAENRPGYSISIIPYQLRQREKTVPMLAELLGIEKEFIEERISSQRFSPMEPVPICRDVGLETVSIVEEHRPTLPGVVVEATPLRYYPWGTLFAHAVGYVGEISREELASLRHRGYRSRDPIGRMGLEEVLEEFLKGRDGANFVEVDARGRELGPLLEKKPIAARPGNDVITTLNVQLQEAAYRHFPKGARGCVVAMDPRTGDVLVYLSIPAADPNLLSSGIHPELWKSLQSDPGAPLWDRVSKGTYPPGSVFKPVVAIAALEKGEELDASGFRPCTGVMDIGNRTYKCWNVHGRLDLHQAIVQSCDVYFYQLAMIVGIDAISDWSSRCGFGRPTGIDLGKEASGFVPTAEWYRSHVGRGTPTRGMVANLGIGQGEILVTALQVCAFTSALASGIYHRPRLVLAIRTPKGELLGKEKTGEWDLPISEETRRTVLDAMLGVVHEPRGTAVSSKIEGIRIAGKTGTAQNPHGPDHAWFVGYADFDQPEICVCALVENAGHGGAVAAPVVGEVIRQYMNSK
jgi:penicillin-binding protein 2